ncbi:MAG: phosphate ABC transporter substrate-binding protein [Tuberibacillus sp.]
MKKIGSLVVLMMFIVGLIACGTDKSGNTDAKTKSDGEKLSGSIVTGGSTALQPLVSAAAEAFMNDNSGTNIEVQGGGSGTGLSEAAKGNFDIGNSDVFAEEKEGIPADELVDHKVAVVGMTAAINKDAGVKDLSKEDLIKVFTGEVTNWKEVGGKDQKITLVNRPDGSGTLATFVKYGLDGAKTAKGITQDASETVKKIVAQTPGAIGYLAFSYFNDDTVVKASIDGVEATNENVQNGKFPIWAYEHMYTKGEPKGLAKAFLEYIMSDDVQNSLVKEQGYIPVSGMKVERDAQGNMTNK